MERVRESRKGQQAVCHMIYFYLLPRADFRSRLKLKALHRFTSTATAVEDITALQNGKLGKGLKQFLTDEVVDKGKAKESLLVVDPHLGESLC